MPNGVRDTSKDDPLLHLVKAMGDSSPGRRPGQFIEDMEKQGQAELASQSQQLPTDGSKNLAWAKMGVIFGETVKDDPIWRKVTLPKGWSIKPTDHSMHSDLVDEKGRARGGIFYKAAFYDRSASIHPKYRYRCPTQYSTPGEPQRWRISRVVDMATGAVLFEKPKRIEPAAQSEYRAFSKLYQADDEECRAWLKEKFPECEDAAAYWDQP
jgi:hypothetical protein